MTATDPPPGLAWDTPAAAAAYRDRDMRLARQLIFPAVLDRVGTPRAPVRPSSTSAAAPAHWPWNWPGPVAGRCRAPTPRPEGKKHVQVVLALALARRRVNVISALIRDRRCYQVTPPVTAAA